YTCPNGQGLLGFAEWAILSETSIYRRILINLFGTQIATGKMTYKLRSNLFEANKIQQKITTESMKQNQDDHHLMTTQAMKVIDERANEHGDEYSIFPLFKLKFYVFKAKTTIIWTKEPLALVRFQPFRDFGDSGKGFQVLKALLVFLVLRPVGSLLIIFLSINKVESFIDVLVYHNFLLEFPFLSILFLSHFDLYAIWSAVIFLLIPNFALGERTSIWQM
ncbi:hypothetical protein ACJX0J_008941, partial [Zea mays]